MLKEANAGPGWVMAINGEWGTGKTTVRNFIEHYLPAKEEPSAPLIFRFNPWMYSGLVELTVAFLDALLGFLRTNKIIEDQGRQYIEKMGSLLQRLPLSFASSGTLGVTVDPTKLLGPDQPEELKNRIGEALAGQKRRVVVLIDDIDRLAVEEIRSLFRAIKAVADFPNVIYVLLFDLGVVSRALASVQGDTGTSYLEKIVQVSFDLPVPDATSLHRLFTTRLDALLNGIEYLPINSTYWGNVFHDGIAPLIDSPRKVVRLLNLIALTFPALKREVNAVDYIAICTLQVFAPNIYRLILRDPELFTKVGDEWGTNTRKEQNRARLDQALAQLGASGPTVQSLLKRIFPQVDALYRNMGFGQHSFSAWYRDRRVCSPEVLPVYFRFAPPESQVTHEEIRELLTSMSDEAAFVERLRALGQKRLTDNTILARHALESLWHYAEEQKQLPATSVPSAIRALFHVGDELIALDPERPGMFGIDMGMVISRLLFRLMRRIRGPQLDTLLEEAAKKAPSLGLLVSEISMFGQSLGKYESEPSSPDDQRVDAPTLAKLEAIGADRIREASRDMKKFFEHRECLSFLWRWTNWGRPDEAKTYVAAAIKSDEHFVQFAQAACGNAYIASIEDRVSSRETRFAVESLDAFGEILIVIARAQEICAKDDTSEPTKRLLNELASQATDWQQRFEQKGNKPQQ